MSMPTPGSAVRGSSSGKPIMALLDLLGRKTALRVLWELSKSDHKFRALQAAAETSPSVLNTRLGELRQARLVELRSEGYHLTSDGQELTQLLLPLSSWSEHWAEGLQRNAKNE